MKLQNNVVYGKVTPVLKLIEIWRNIGRTRNSTKNERQGLIIKKNN